MKTRALLIAAGTAVAFGSNVNADPVIWDNQFVAASLGSSQLDTIYPFDSQIADDFILDDDYYVTDVHWWGGFWNGTPFDPIEFNIYFYADDGTGNAPTLPVPGSALATYNFPAVNGVFDAGFGADAYDVDLPGQGFVASANTKYWIAIQAVFPFPPQWGWSTAGPGNLSSAKQGFPLLGTPYWSDPGFGDANWYLTGVPVPAPSSLAMLGLGGLMIRRRR